MDRVTCLGKSCLGGTRGLGKILHWMFFVVVTGDSLRHW